MPQENRKHRMRLKPATAARGVLKRAYRSFVATDRKIKLAFGSLGLVGIVGWMLSRAPDAWEWADRAMFRYPVEVTYVDQRETKAGYLFELEVKSTSGSAVFVPRDDVEVRIVRNDRLVEAMSADDRKRLLYGETAKVFDNYATLQAEIDGRTYTQDPTIACTARQRPLFLLVTVAGPASANPSARLQLAPVYRSVIVGVRRNLRTSVYGEIPIRHVSVVAGNSKTRVIQR